MHNTKALSVTDFFFVLQSNSIPHCNCTNKCKCLLGQPAVKRSSDNKGASGQDTRCTDTVKQVMLVI